MLFPIFFGFIAPDDSKKETFDGLKSAIALATKLTGQLSVAIGARQLRISSLLSASTVKGLVAAENKYAVKSAEAALAAVMQIAGKNSVTVHAEILKGDLAQLKVAFSSRARLHGLVFAQAGRPSAVLSSELNSELIEPLLFDSGRPVFVVPDGYNGPLNLDKIVIAWDGSSNAARAVWDSTALLRQAKQLEIVTVTGEKDLGNAAPAEKLAPMLSFLGKDTNVTTIKLDGSSPSQLIRDHATKTGAGLIVQGAYGRSRWSEFILGGVTREMLRDSTLPLMLSH